jgi:hypothetical protein
MNCTSLDANQSNAIEPVAFAPDLAVDNGDPALAAYDDSRELERLLRSSDRNARRSRGVRAQRISER